MVVLVSHNNDVSIISPRRIVPGSDNYTILAAAIDGCPHTPGQVEADMDRAAIVVVVILAEQGGGRVQTNAVFVIPSNVTAHG